jgi:hypothetical protein
LFPQRTTAIPICGEQDTRQDAAFLRAKKVQEIR